MAGLNATLEIARSTLLNSQVMIQTASHNISNADNKSYARQKALLTTNPAMRTYAGWLGMGANIYQVMQQRDLLIERQLMKATADGSEYKTITDHLDISAAYLADDGENGLSQVLGEFWDAWDRLNQNPGLSERTGVYEAAQNLAGSIRSTHSNLEGVIRDLEGEIEDTLDGINDLLNTIHRYNEQIAKSEGPNMPANDLRDRRYQAMMELSDLISFRSRENENGTVDIRLEDSTTLVSGSPSGIAGLVYTSHGDGTFSITTTDGTAVAAYAKTASGDLEVGYEADISGKLKGLLESLRHTDTCLDRLDTFKTTLIAHVNTTYSNANAVPPGSSWPPPPPAPPWPAGAIFVEGDYIELAPDFTAASIDEMRAIDMSNLQETEFVELGGNSFGDYLIGIQKQIGMYQQNAISQGSFHEALRRQIEAQQQSVSGVSIDEEMIELIKYQQVYQAAAKMIQQTSEMLNTVIEMV